MSFLTPLQQKASGWLSSRPASSANSDAAIVAAPAATNQVASSSTFNPLALLAIAAGLLAAVWYSLKSGGKKSTRKGF